MKKSILTISICLLSIVALSQKQDTTKRDTTIQVTMNINQLRALLGAIDANIDSKKVSKEILEFIKNNAKMMQPADKPKEIGRN